MEQELLTKIFPWVQEMRLSLIQSHTIGCTDDPDDIPVDQVDIREEVDFLTEWLDDCESVLEQMDFESDL
jgi:hypothetical protein